MVTDRSVLTQLLVLLSSFFFLTLLIVPILAFGKYYYLCVFLSIILQHFGFNSDEDSLMTHIVGMRFPDGIHWARCQSKEELVEVHKIAILLICNISPYLTHFFITGLILPNLKVLPWFLCRKVQLMCTCIIKLSLSLSQSLASCYTMAAEDFLSYDGLDKLDLDTSHSLHSIDSENRDRIMEEGEEGEAPGPWDEFK